MPPLHPRHRVDASFADALHALAVSARLPSPRTDALGGAMVCLSVRSAFDLLLTALGLPRGDDVLVSAVTHPDMVRIIELHGLRPVPVDLDPSTLAPDPVALREAVSERARMIVVAHLFGSRVDLDDVVEVARQRHLLLIEDCAQSIEGSADRGDARADVSLFSFGFIKTATALGGALAWVREAGLAAEMHRRHERWPVQPRREHAAKALKCLAALAVTNPRLYGVVAGGGRDPAVLVRTIRGLDDVGFVDWFRRQPSDALVATLRRRSGRFPANRLRRRAAAGDDLAAALPPALFRPGRAALRPSYWLFPVVTDDPGRLIAALRANGFDASSGASQICAVPPAPPRARVLMAGLVFLPLYPEMTQAERWRMATVVRAVV